MEQLSACAVLRRVTELQLHFNPIDMSIFAYVAETMPQLVVLDLSHSSTRWPPFSLHVCGSQQCEEYGMQAVSPFNSAPSLPLCKLVSGSTLIAALHRGSLRHVWYPLCDQEHWAEEAETLMEVQRAVPHVQWHLRAATRSSFDETRQFCSRNVHGRRLVMSM